MNNVGDQLRDMLDTYSLGLHLLKHGIQENRLHHQLHNNLGEQFQDQVWAHIHDHCADRLGVAR